MNLHDIELKSEYDSISDDVYDEFFNRVLEHSRKYNRIGGKFTSKNFAACAEGLQEFIQNDGHMKLVILPEFNAEDIDSINNGIKNANDIISECWIRDFSEIQEKFVKDHTKALAWMLANDHLEIKIVIPVDSRGAILSGIKLDDSQLFKRKTGIFWDDDNNAMSFSGNIDFDDKMFGEYHHFRVYRGWDDSERKFLDRDYEEFCRYWDGQPIESDVRLKSIPLPEAVRKNLIEIAPKSKSEIRLQKVPQLRPYQKTAIRNWREKDHRGILEMATGTGKTFAAIGCIEELQKTQETLQVIIVCPFDNIERQWKQELAKWGFDSAVTSGDTKWDQRMKDKIASLETKNRDISIVITTYKTFCTNRFINMVENCGVPLLLIADEVHNAGASAYVSGLTNAYNYRLGLSATLERYFDPDGTALLQRFFGDTVYTLDLQSAIEKKFLVGYYYYPMHVDLNEEEYEKYSTYTRIIARLWNSKKFEDREKLELTLINRSRVILNAEGKIAKFRDWVQEHKDSMEYSLVYCSENQMDTVKKILDRSAVINREITHKNPSKPTLRADIIKKFSKGLFNAIVANRVLDEGADIPAAKNCIMLASTGNPKQFIQRRGRVLRRFKERYPDGSKKENANIYDLLVIPSISEDYTDDEIRIERQIVTSQIRRLEEMASIAINRESCMADIESLKEKFSIS